MKSHQNKSREKIDLPRENFFARSAAIFSLLFVLGFSIYSNILRSPFQFDDEYAIVKNGAIRNLADTGAIWNAFHTRFVTGWTLALNYFFGGLDPFGYHVFNVLIHVFSSFLVYCLVRLVQPDAYRKPWPALLAALLFLTHPIQTQAVTYLWQRCASLTALFYLAALVCYLKARLGPSRWWYALALVSALLAMFCKEIAVTLPGAIFLCEICFLNAKGSSFFRRLFLFLPFLFLAILPPLLLKQADSLTLNLMRPETLASSANGTGWTDLARFASEKSMPAKTYFLTEVNVLRTYLRLLFSPVGQRLDYDYPLVSAPDASWFFSFLLIAGTCTAAFLIFKKNRLAAFGIFLFFLALSVESLVVQTDVLFEHRLYLPMAGFSLFIAGVFFAKDKWHDTAMVILLFVIAVFSVMAYQRNKVWQSELSLWDDSAQKSPGKARPFNGRGVAHKKNGELEKAIADYSEAIRLDPSFSDALNNRGLIYKSLNQIDKAISDYDRAIEVDPSNAEVYSNRCVAYYLKGDYSLAIGDCTKSIELDPRSAEAYINRGACYESQNLPENALKDYEAALRIDDTLAQAYYNKGVAHQAMKDLPAAIRDYSEAIHLDGQIPQAYGNRGILYAMTGEMEKSIEDLSMAIRLNPQDLSAYRNRGLVYEKMGDHARALQDFEKSSAA